MSDKSLPKELLDKYPHFRDFLDKKDKFILDENRNVIPATLMEWGTYLEEHRGERIVKKDVINGLKVSTVFFGLDHKWSLPEEREAEDYKPHVFETMIFKDGKDIYCTRYSTWTEAEEGHQKAIEWVNNGCIEDDEEDLMDE